VHALQGFLAIYSETDLLIEQAWDLSTDCLQCRLVWYRTFGYCAVDRRLLDAFIVGDLKRGSNMLLIIFVQSYSYTQ